MTIAIPAMPVPLQSDIDRLEAVVRGPLPASYLEFIRSHDGATPESNTIEIGTGGSGVRYFIAVADAPLVFDQVEGFPAATVPLAEDDCGNFFYMDRESGAVFFWDHEWEGDTEVASSLAGFLSALMPFDPSSVELAPGQVISAWINPAFKAHLD